MTLRAQNILPGDILLEWLQEQDSFVCLHCHQIVATLVLCPISKKCSGSVAGAGSPQVSVTPTLAVLGQENSNVPGPDDPLPSFEEVCHLQCATVRHIPQKARPLFAQVLSDLLRSICVSNKEEA